MAATNPSPHNRPGMPRGQVVLFLFPVLFIGLFAVANYRQVSDLNERITAGVACLPPW